MKISKTIIMAGLGSLLLQGCIAFPPLVQVEHKHAAPPPAAMVAPAPASNSEVLKRLDAIDRRLEQLEKNQAK